MFASIRIKPLLILALAAMAVLVGSSIVSQQTRVRPDADQPDAKFQLLLPTLPPAAIQTPPASLPTPACTVDKDQCTTCCSILNSQTICQERACPTYR